MFARRKAFEAKAASGGASEPLGSSLQSSRGHANSALRAAQRLGGKRPASHIIVGLPGMQGAAGVRGYGSADDTRRFGDPENFAASLSVFICRRDCGNGA